MILDCDKLVDVARDGVELADGGELADGVKLVGVNGVVLVDPESLGRSHDNLRILNGLESSKSWQSPRLHTGEIGLIWIKEEG